MGTLAPFTKKLMANETIRAMIIEGDDDFRQTFLSLLSLRFPSLIFQEEKDGVGTLKKIKGFHPHIVFMDIKLPKARGLELSQELRQLYPDLVIVIVTGLDLPEYRDAAHKSGADHFISKNTSSAKDVLDIVESILKGLDPSRINP